MKTNMPAITTAQMTASPSFTPREPGVRIPHRPLELRQKRGERDTASDTAPRLGPFPPFTANPITGCHIWERSVDKDGYGYFRVDGKVIVAHRYYYEQAKGEVPPGLVLDHLCRNRQCVNADHLEPVTHIENCRRGRLVKHMTIERAREVRARQSAGQTHSAIAADMGITKSLVAQIVTNRCWKDFLSPTIGGAP